VSLYYAIYGQGEEPVILLHGGAGNADHWANQVPALAERFQVIVVDSRGHGRSTRDGRPLSYALMADDLLELMNALHLERPSLVGWSDGGAVALDFALRHPQRVRRLVAYGTNFDLSGAKRGGGVTFTAYFARCAADYARLSPTPRDYRGLLEVLRPMWRTQPNFTRQQLAGLQVPTLVLTGDHDEIVRREHLEELVVKAVDEAGGYGMLMGPQSTAAERAEFRARIEAEPRRYIAQRRLELSTCPTWDAASHRVVPRRVDLRPYSLIGPSGPWVLPGGLTRVALAEGSYIVNSSQGGGSKDTWVLKP